MKKTSFLLIVVLLSVFSLSANANWIGVQGLQWQSDQTLRIRPVEDDPLSFSSKPTGLGAILAGSYYLSGESPFGIGYQFGATSTKSLIVDKVTFSASSDSPLEWRAGLSGEYRAEFSPLLSLEIGAGLLFERSEKLMVPDENIIIITTTEINFLTSANLLIHFSDQFSLVGSLDYILFLSSNSEFTFEGESLAVDADVEGHAFEVRLGIAFSV